MQLIERYLQAVKFWLPRRQQADITAELHSNLLAQVEDKEVALGRPLEEEEEAAILRHFEPPALAAARYCQDQGTVALGRQLIGPLVFPFYAVAVKATLCITALLAALPVAIAVLSGSDHIMQKVIQSGWDFAWRAPQVLMVVTVIFTALDSCLRKYRFAERWNPRSLPALDRAGRGVPRAKSLAGIVIQVVFILWWLSLPDIAQVNFGPWKPVPIWQTLYLPSLWIAIIVLAQHIVNFLRPRWDWLPPLSALATSIASLVLIYPLRHVYPLLLHADPNPSARAAMQTAKLEAGLQIAISWTCIGIAIVIAVEAWKLYRMTRGLLPKGGVPSSKPGVLA